MLNIEKKPPKIPGNILLTLTRCAIDMQNRYSGEKNTSLKTPTTKQSSDNAGLISIVNNAGTSQMWFYTCTRAIPRQWGPRSGYHLQDVVEKFDLFCLENGRLHREPPFSLKRTILTGWKGFFKMAASTGGCHLQLKEQFSLAEPSINLEEPFASYLKSEVPRRQILNANWGKNP